MATTDDYAIFAGQLGEFYMDTADELNGLATDLQDVTDGTAKIRQALKAIADIDKAIAIATVVLELRAAIVTRNAAGLAAALQTIGSI